MTQTATPDSPDFRDKYVNVHGVEVNLQGSPRLSDARCAKCGTILYRSARDADRRCANENCEDSAYRSQP